MRITIEMRRFSLAKGSFSLIGWVEAKPRTAHMRPGAIPLSSRMVRALLARSAESSQLV
ncbi:hypothetical protein D3C86_2244700 [compost metagenome]